MKKIVFTIVDNGTDGREPDHIVEAFYDETERDKAFDNSPNKGHYRKREQILDVDLYRKELLKKLTGVDKLILFPPKEKLAMR